MWQRLQAGVEWVSRPALGTVKRFCYVVLAAVVILAVLTPESSGPDSVCQWPRDSGEPLDLTDPHQDQHLSRDARKAEDLAIRYADGHARPGHGHGTTMGEYLRTLDGCKTDLFLAVAEHHHVTLEEVRKSLDRHRNAALDALAMFFFGLLYGFWVDSGTRRIWRRFPPKEDRLFGVIATIVISPVVSLFAVVFGEWWANAVEFLRVGYGHLVERVSRIPWVNHRMAIFVAGIFVFWLLSWRQYREAGSGKGRDSAVLGVFGDSLRGPTGQQS